MAFTEIKKTGLKILDDIGLAGFSNNDASSLLDPPLTAVEQPSCVMGKTSAQFLLDQILSDDKNYNPKSIVLKTDFSVREST